MLLINGIPAMHIKCYQKTQHPITSRIDISDSRRKHARKKENILKSYVFFEKWRHWFKLKAAFSKILMSNVIGNKQKAVSKRLAQAVLLERWWFKYSFCSYRLLSLLILMKYISFSDQFSGFLMTFFSSSKNYFFAICRTSIINNKI